MLHRGPGGLVADGKILKKDEILCAKSAGCAAGHTGRVASSNLGAAAVRKGCALLLDREKRCAVLELVFGGL